MESLPLIVIVGPTASGKTGLSIKIAKRYNGEVISADSRAIYKGMDIGAAKPTLKERDGIPHWGIDLVKPGERFTAADFQAYATEKIADIRSRGKLPILVGGTGLYVDALLFGYEFPAEADQKKRERLEKKSIQELHEYCVKNNVLLPENKFNKRYVINTILHNNEKLKRNKAPIANALIVGITTDKVLLRERIGRRAAEMFDYGVIAEAEQLAAQYGWGGEAMTGNIYPIIHKLLNNEISLPQARDLSATKDWQLAKRQITWLNRNEYIKWFSLSEAHTYLTHTLDSLNNP